MNRRPKVFLLVCLLLAVCSVTLASLGQPYAGGSGRTVSGAAQEAAQGIPAFQATTTGLPTNGPSRRKILTVDFTKYEWWLSRWQDNQVLCSVVIEHEGLPFAGEIQTQCSPAVYTLWLNTKPCPEAEAGNITLCTGVYMHLVQTWPGSRQITVDLPPAAAWIDITGCSPASPPNRCDNQPSLLVTGEEPLPNELIVSVNGLLNGRPFACMGGACEVPLSATGMQGVPVEFWVDSSFGDSSKHFTAQVRVVPWGNFVAPEGSADDPPLWYVDVMSTQWRGAPLASCSQIWESFPDLGGPPAWLTTPERAEVLASAQPFYYLAGELIQSGEVDASDCPSGGLQSPGVANACGMEKARPAVVEWQNQFDAQIIQVAQDTGVPAQLMKNIFSRESQFWPGIFRTFRETGLGQMTENGADTALLWNPSFFDQFCPLVFEQGVCERGFVFLKEEQQNILKGALVNKVNAACPDCPAGIDLSQARFSVSVFAQTLIANCQQAGQIVFNTANRPSGLSSSYTDLWRFTLVNYNAGSGCLSEAMLETYRSGLPLDWTNVSQHLDEACQAAVAYVEEIESIGPTSPTPTPTATPRAPGELPTFPAGTPSPTRTVSPGAPQTPTPGGAGYPEPGVTPTLADYPEPQDTPTIEGYP